MTAVDRTSSSLFLLFIACTSLAAAGCFDPDDLDGARPNEHGCEDGYTLDKEVCRAVPDGCGNRRLDPGEECDGALLGEQTCASRGKAGGTLTCSPLCTFDTTSCEDAQGGGTTPICGNGVREGEEQCDGDDLAAMTCSNGSARFCIVGCVLSPCDDEEEPVATCSDGLQNQGEEGIDCGRVCQKLCPGVPTCADKMQNQGEEGIDCGGPCLSECDAPTCDDGAKNQDEEGVDCGGATCEACVVKQLEMGEAYACALSESGTIKCWGDNASGQLGRGDFTASMEPAPVAGVEDAIQLSVGRIGQNACALIADGTVKCWGSNRYGQLGDGSMVEHSSVPVTVQGISSAASLYTTGATHCAVLREGTVECWGANNGPFEGEASLYTPVRVPQLTGVTTLSMMGLRNSFCALTVNGDISCWGHNESGQLGHGEISQSPATVPVEVEGISDAIDILAGDEHQCALLQDATLKCWGSNLLNQLGSGTNFDAASPVAVQMLSGIVSVTRGLVSQCALLDTGEVKCWGSNIFGELGVGDSNETYVPLPVVDLQGATLLAGSEASATHHCAIIEGGKVKCWGYNSDGALGNDELAPEKAVLVDGVEGARDLFLGNARSCALLETGQVTCWGMGYGSTPTIVEGL